MGKRRSLDDELRRMEILRKDANLGQEEQERYKKIVYEKEAENIKYVLINKRNNEIGKWLALVTKKDSSCMQDYEESLKLTKLNFNDDDPIIIFLETWPNNSRPELQTVFAKIKRQLDEYRQSIEREINGIHESIIKKDDLLKPFNEKIKNKKAFEEAERNIVSLKGQIQAIEIKEDEKIKTNKHFQDVFLKVNQSYGNLFEAYKALFDIFNKLEEKPVSEIMQIIPKMDFDAEQFDREFMSTINKLYNISSELSFDKDKKYIYKPGDHVNEIAKIADAVLRQSKGLIKLKDKGSSEDAFRCLYRDYFKINFEIKSGDDDLFTMSPGKRGIILVYLFVHLSNANYPIIIDQPEDNLDNRSIYEQLCVFLREKKKQRQIILVSHNPNLVVSTDSEEVIVCNRSGEQAQKENEKYIFEYKSGSLENSNIDAGAKGTLNKMGIREHVCEILEGGLNAFELREKKYGLYRQI